MNQATEGAEACRARCIGIALGDVTGIGPEITLKALRALQEAEGEATQPGQPAPRFVILGDGRWIERTNRDIGLEIKPFASVGARSSVTLHEPALSPTLSHPMGEGARLVRRSFTSEGGRAGEGDGQRSVVPEPGRQARVAFVDPRTEPLPLALTAGAPLAARAAVDWLRHGAALCLAGKLDALVTAPVSKQAILAAGVPFVGQTEFLAGLAGVPDPVMMLLGQDDRGRWLRVALVTTHLPLRAVADAVTPDKVQRAIACAVEACHLLGLDRARVAVCGLNPHAGEGGHFGREEIEVVAPAVNAARAQGLDAHGPLAADTLFHQAWRGEYDAVVAMYHDQGLAPLKLIAFDTGVNWTLGLPFIRTSPDHGTAYELAGRNTARPDSMLAAIRLAVRLAQQRTERG